MKLELTDVSQKFSLKTRLTENYLVFELPSGRIVEVPVSDEVTSLFLLEAVGPSAPIPAPPPPPPPPTSASRLSSPPPPPPAPIENRPVVKEQIMVDWRGLSDADLPTIVKEILVASDIQTPLPIEELAKLKFQILSELNQQPKTGEVNWNTGPQRPVTSSPMRTVPQDEAGNPLPPGGISEPADPGEVADDDDQVAQL
jgi:hypothetical protein